MRIKAAWGAPATIRLRLGAALAIALLPVLALGVTQSMLSYRQDAEGRVTELSLGAYRSASTARARIEAGAAVLETLAPDTVGFQCAQRLAQVAAKVPGYVNLVRFDSIGRVACAAADVPQDRDRRDVEWFQRLRAGDNLVITRAPPGVFGSEPALIAGIPLKDPDGAFAGAMAAVISLQSLRPSMSDRSLPEGSQVALIDDSGEYLTRSDVLVFARPPPNWSEQAGKLAFSYTARDAAGEDRIYAASALVSDDVFVVISAPVQSAWSWARLNVVSSVLPPLLAFILALMAVWIVSEQVVIRWLHYLQRIAAIYARGRFTVRPVKAERAPPEIRELAETLDIMADAIVARDQSLHESLAHKDGLMREIHHRVKNNLQVISSLVSMQQRALTDPAARAAMSDTRMRISALALVYRALYQGPDLRRVDLKQFLEELIAQLIVADGPQEHGVRTELSADDLIIEPDKLAPLALFAVEAITNAQKHAFAGRGGRLSVTFRVEGEEAVLEIADSGDGKDEPTLGSGVGRTLMMAFARQLGGRAEFEPNAHGGLTARLNFPTPGETPAAHAAKAKPVAGKPRRNQAAA